MLPDGELPDCVSVVPSQHLRDSDAEEKRVIYNALDQGLCTVEVKFEAQGRPVRVKALRATQRMLDFARSIQQKNHGD